MAVCRRAVWPFSTMSAGWDISGTDSESRGSRVSEFVPRISQQLTDSVEDDLTARQHTAMGQWILKGHLGRKGKEIAS